MKYHWTNLMLIQKTEYWKTSDSSRAGSPRGMYSSNKKTVQKQKKRKKNSEEIVLEQAAYSGKTLSAQIRAAEVNSVTNSTNKLTTKGSFRGRRKNCQYIV